MVLYHLSGNYQEKWEYHLNATYTINFNYQLVYAFCQLKEKDEPLKLIECFLDVKPRENNVVRQVLLNWFYYRTFNIALRKWEQ